MSQEFTFQIQEFYSKVLWCTYIYGSEDRDAAVCPKGQPRPLLGKSQLPPCDLPAESQKEAF